MIPDRIFSWRDVPGRADRTEAESRRSLFLVMLLSFFVFYSPRLKLTLLKRFVAPQNDARFWEGVLMEASRLSLDPEKMRAILDDPTERRFSKEMDILVHLSDFQYVTDQKQFGRADYWQNPSEFEERRKGDCDDFALYVWHHLCKMGKDARFVVGKHGYSLTGHAWVVVYENGKRSLYECATYRRTGALRKTEEDPAVRRDYLPVMSVDSECRTYWHG